VGEARDLLEWRARGRGRIWELGNWSEQAAGMGRRLCRRRVGGRLGNFRIFWRWWASVFGRSGAIWSIGFEGDGWLGLVLVGSTRIVGVRSVGVVSCVLIGCHCAAGVRGPTRPCGVGLATVGSQLLGREAQPYK